MACTTRATSTTPAASPSSRGSTRARFARGRRASAARARATSSTAAPTGADPETGRRRRASCSSSPTRSCAAEARRRAARAGPLRRRDLLPPAASDADGGRAAARATASRPRASASLGWRDVPVERGGLRRIRAQPSRRGSPSCSWAPPTTWRDQDAFERKLYVIRRGVEHAGRSTDLAIPSFSSRTIVYKGMLTAPQLAALLPRPARRARA